MPRWLKAPTSFGFRLIRRPHASIASSPDALLHVLMSSAMAGVAAIPKTDSTATMLKITGYMPASAISLRDRIEIRCVDHLFQRNPCRMPAAKQPGPRSGTALRMPDVAPDPQSPGASGPRQPRLGLFPGRPQKINYSVRLSVLAGDTRHP